MKNATHVYYGTKEPTYYHVKSKFFLLFFWGTVHFWDVYQSKWVRSWCHPSIRKMEKL